MTNRLQDKYPEYSFARERRSSYSNSIADSPVKSYKKQNQNLNYSYAAGPSFNNYVRPSSSSIQSISQSAPGVQPSRVNYQDYRQLRPSNYQNQPYTAQTRQDYRQAYSPQKDSSRNQNDHSYMSEMMQKYRKPQTTETYKNQVSKSVSQVSASIPNPFNEEMIAKFNQKIASHDGNKAMKEIQVFSEMIKMIPISNNSLTSEESQVLQQELSDLQAEKTQSKLQTSSMLIMIFRFFLQSQEFQFFIKRLKNVANTKINFKPTPKKTPQSKLNSEKKMPQEGKENNYSHIKSFDLESEKLRIQDKQHSQQTHLNKSIMLDEEDASTAAGKTESVLGAEPIQLKIGRMTITTPAAWARTSVDDSAKKQDSVSEKKSNPGILKNKNLQQKELQELEQQRISKLYDKLMKSDYETSFDKSYKDKKLESNQKSQQVQFSGVNILESQKEGFSLIPQKCFNSRDMAENHTQKSIKCAGKSSVTQAQAYSAIEQLLNIPHGSLVNQFVSSHSKENEMHTPEKQKPDFYSEYSPQKSTSTYNQRQSISPYYQNALPSQMNNTIKDLYSKGKQQNKQSDLNKSIDSGLYQKYQNELRSSVRFQRF